MLLPLVTTARTMTSVMEDPSATQRKISARLVPSLEVKEGF